MKKSTLAISIIAGLAVITTAGSYYTGTEAEKQYHQLIEQANQQLKQTGLNAEIKQGKFERGLFSSKVSNQITFTDEQGKTYLFNDEGELFHGPFPLNQLSQGHFMPMLASYDHTLQSAEKLPFFKENTLLAGNTSLGYGQALQFDYEIKPIDYQQDQNTLEISPIHITADVQTNKEISYQISLPKISLTAQSSSQPFTLEIAGLNYKDKQIAHPDYPNLSSGKGTFEVKTVTYQDQKKPFQFMLDKYEGENSTEIKAQRFNYLSQSHFNMALIYEDQKIELGKLNYATEIGLDAKTLDHMVSLIPNLKDEQALKEFTSNALELLQKEPHLAIKPYAFSNDKGEVASLNLDLNLNPFDIEQLSQFKDMTQALSLLKPSELKLQVNLSPLEKLLTQFGSIAKDPNAEQQAKTMIAALKQQAASVPYVQLNDNSANFKLNIANGTLSINDKALSEQEVQGLMFGLMMMLGSIH